MSAGGEQKSSCGTAKNGIYIKIWGICKIYGVLVECSAPDSFYNLHLPRWLEPDSDSTTSVFRCPEYTSI
jgi:hypothetical protein